MYQVAGSTLVAGLDPCSPQQVGVGYYGYAAHGHRRLRYHRMQEPQNRQRDRHHVVEERPEQPHPDLVESRVAEVDRRHQPRKVAPDQDDVTGLDGDLKFDQVHANFAQFSGTVGLHANSPSYCYFDDIIIMEDIS